MAVLLGAGATMCVLRRRARYTWPVLLFDAGRRIAIMLHFGEGAAVALCAVLVRHRVHQLSSSRSQYAPRASLLLSSASSSSSSPSSSSPPTLSMPCVIAIAGIIAISVVLVAVTVLRMPMRF